MFIEVRRYATCRTVEFAVAEYPDRTQLQQIIAGLKEGVLLIEPDRALTYANHSFLEMHGVHKFDALGRSVDAYLANYVVQNRAGEAAGGAVFVNLEVLRSGRVRSNPDLAQGAG